MMIRCFMKFTEKFSLEITARNDPLFCSILVTISTQNPKSSRELRGEKMTKRRELFRDLRRCDMIYGQSQCLMFFVFSLCVDEINRHQKFPVTEFNQFRHVYGYFSIFLYICMWLIFIFPAPPELLQENL